MTIVVWGMMSASVAALIAGVVLAGGRLRAASGVGRLLVLGPVFEAGALAMFAAEHFLAARDLMSIVPRWLPAPLFWTYFVGGALLAAAVSFIAWRCVRLSAALLALLFVIIVVTVDLPRMGAHAHDRLFWTLTVRELAFAAGAIVLSGSLSPAASPSRGVLTSLGRALLAGVFVFYAVQHFMFPRFVPGVPLEKLTPAWMPASVAISYVVGFFLLLGGPGLLSRPVRRFAAAGVGAVLLLLTAFFYVPIFVTEMRGPLALEGLNYVGDTMLFAATALLAGFGSSEDIVGTSGPANS